jgi:hypothetical protein
MIGLLEERAPDLKHHLLNWLDAEPQIGRRFRIYVGPDSELAEFVMIITGVQDDMWVLWDERSSSRTNAQSRLVIPRDHWGRYFKRGLIFCEDWL